MIKSPAWPLPFEYKFDGDVLDGNVRTLRVAKELREFNFEFLDSLPDPFYILDASLRLIYANRSALALWKTPSGEVLGKPLVEILPQVKDTEVWRAHLDVNATRQARRFETVSPVIHRLIEVMIAPAGSGLAVQLHDVSEKRQLRLALGQSKAWLRALFAQAAVGLETIAPDGRILEVNDAFCALVRRPRSALSGTRVDDLTHPDDRPRERELTARLLRGELPSYEIEKRLIAADGEPVWVRVTQSPVRRDGEIRWMMAVVQDATEKRRAEQALRDVNKELERLLEERTRDLRHFFQLSSDIVAIAHKDGRIRAVNPAWQRTTGHDTDALCDRPLLEFVHPDDRSRTRAKFRRILRDGATRGLEHRVRHANGSWRWIAWAITPSPAEGLLYAIGRDITAERDAEQQRRRQQKMEAIGQLTGVMAHDFRNLLTVVLTGLDAIRMKIRNDPDAALDIIDRLLQTIERGGELAGSLLRVARGRAGTHRTTAVNKLIRDDAALLKSAAGPRIELHFSLDDRIGSLAIDPAEFESALLNLVNNARDAMPDGGALHIATALKRERRRSLAEVTVRDTGHGMTGAALERAFEPFFTTRCDRGGTGLGLWQVYEFTRKSGGSATIRSEPGIGTTVILEFATRAGDG